ncbi:SDR family oxidoreductase [Bradyrhizobium rifense]|uniref:SDR family oxidoreductase n=1 Tax=Bradyrhizobium rifense TaxID=515499 RepID=A0A5D3K3D5_9BRAD|nr:SDR family oxidoreductase [Bradyrhizobium rifense]TYL89160.1 SDR family oxidoreductase [Bradyrhizobium rifense]
MRENVRHGGLTQVSNDVWIFDAARLQAAGLPLPLRMTVIRLSTGDLLLHSPVKYSPALRALLERLGPIKYLLAPNVAHWMFLRCWQTAMPEMVTLAVPGLASRNQVRRSGVRIDRELGDGTPDEWANDIETVLVSAPFFCEVELFDKRSRTLILTDIVQNIDPGIFPGAVRPIADLLGVTTPDGMAPVYLRLLLRLGGCSVQAAARRLVSFAPEKVIFAHGDWFDSRGTERLRHSLRWLLPQSGSGRVAGENEMAGTRVVITGASSGIGRAAALAFAEKGASVVLAARRADALERLASECESVGGRALAVPTDVTDAEAVKRLAAKADQSFGGIDVWINNAGTGVFGAFQEADIALHRKTVEVNLLGTMNGAHAVLPIFLRQQRGILINNISLGGWAPTPFAAAYTASKFGLRGFTSSLRQELAAQPDIHVCGVFPAMVDTPGFVHGANMSGRRLDPGPLLYQPEDVAEAFLSLVRQPRSEIAVGWPARAGQIAFALAPRATEHLLGSAFRWLLSRARQAEKTEGTIVEAAPQGTSADGGWLARKRLPPAAQVSKLIALMGIATLVLASASRAAALPRRRQVRRSSAGFKRRNSGLSSHRSR